MGDILEIPRREASQNDKMAWLQQLTQLGQMYSSEQPGWKDIGSAKALLSGRGMKKAPEGQSDLEVPFAAQWFKELVAQLTNLQTKWGYIAEDKRFKDNERVLNGCFKNWWQVIHGPLRVKEALQYAGIGKGWIEPFWNPHFYGIGRGEIDLKVRGPEDVFLVMPSQDGDPQKAFAVVIKDEMPLHQARMQWPELRDKIVATRGRATWMSAADPAGSAVSKYHSPVMKMLSTEKTIREKDTSYPTVDVFYCYIQDPSINETGTTMSFGHPDTPWFYEVPSIGSMVPTGVKNPQGEDIMRAATLEECRMYPFRRLIIATDTMIIKDDTSPYWHGKAPVVPFDIYKWAWDFISRPAAAQLRSMQDAYTGLMRTVVDSANLRLDPPLVYDKTAHSMQQIKTFNPRKPGGRLQMDLAYGVTVKPLLDVKHFDVPAWLVQFLDKLPEQMRQLAGLGNMQDVAKAAQIPSDDTIDKIMDLNGPVIEDQAREMERSLTKLGEMVKWNIFEFYNTAKRMQIMGPDGLTQEDFDYEPGLMVPDHMPGEDKEQPSQYSLAHRARWHAANFIFNIVPTSSYNQTDMQRKMLYLQLFRNGYPIDPETVSETLGLPNWGDLGDGPILEKFFKWQELQMQFQMSMQAAAAQAQLAASPEGQMMQQLQQLAASQPPQGAETRGRKPSGQEAPRMIQKDGPDGPRTVISESGG